MIPTAIQSGKHFPSCQSGNHMDTSHYTASQLKELFPMVCLRPYFPICIGLIPSVLDSSLTVSVVRSFSMIKTIKTYLCNSLNDCSLSQLIRIFKMGRLRMTQKMHPRKGSVMKTLPSKQILPCLCYC